MENPKPTDNNVTALDLISAMRILGAELQTVRVLLETLISKPVLEDRRVSILQDQIQQLLVREHEREQFIAELQQQTATQVTAMLEVAGLKVGPATAERDVRMMALHDKVIGRGRPGGASR